MIASVTDAKSFYAEHYIHANYSAFAWHNRTYRGLGLDACVGSLGEVASILIVEVGKEDPVPGEDVWGLLNNRSYGTSLVACPVDDQVVMVEEVAP